MKEASTYKEPLGGKMGKITGKLKHTVNAFPDLQTKFFLQTMRHLDHSTKFQ